jgi:hypothetical protein
MSENNTSFGYQGDEDKDLDPIVEPAVEEIPTDEPQEEVIPETKVEEIAAEFNIEASIEEVIEVEPTAITTASLARSSSETSQSIGSVVNGVIGVAQKPKSPKKSTVSASKEVKKETIAIHSTRNVTWSGVGKVYIGYNIVEKEAAEKWLTRSHCRAATPEEVAKEFGK